MVTAQSVPCEDIIVQACTNTDDNCFRVEIPFFFSYIGGGTPSNFDAEGIEINFVLEGNAVFDYELMDLHNPTAYTPSNIELNAGDETSLKFVGACEFGPFYPDFTNCEEPAFLIYIIVEPGGSFELTTTVDAYYQNNTALPCKEDNDDCIDEIGGSDPIIEKETPSACPSDLSIEIKHLPTGPVSPHEEVQLALQLYNNGTSSVTLSEADFRIRLSDLYGTLEAFALNAASGSEDPLIYNADGDEYYFFLNSFDDAVIEASSSVPLLSFSILPPDGLDNLLGAAEVELMAANISIEGGPCCALDIEGVDGTVTFPGELPCEGGPLEDIQFVIDEYPIPANLTDCEVGFVVYISSPDAWDAEHLLMELELDIEGSMYIESVTLIGGLAACSGCLSFTGNTITYDFDDAMNPLDIGIFNDEGFIVVLDGLNGSLDAVEFLQAAIEVDGVSGACIPEIITDPGISLPLESGCDYCSDIFVQIGSYTGALDTDECENGFGIYLRAPSSQDYDRIFVEFQIDNPDDLMLEITSAQCGSNNCPPAGSGGQSYGSCVYYWSATGIVHYSYCPASPPVTGTVLHLLDVKFTGVGCIPTVTFFETTKVLEDGANDYCWPLVYQSTPLPLCNDCPDPEFTISGNIRTETGAGVYIDDDPNDQGIFIIGGEEISGCPDITDSYDCKEVTSTPSGGGCSGEYNLTFTCVGDEEFSITPFKDVDYTNGVTTHDLLLIQRHILNVAPLGSPYKIIAADVNRSGNVSGADMIIIRKAILHIIEDFDGHPSWRFIDASYTFPTPSNPFLPPFDDYECIRVDLSVDNAIGMKDFIGVKNGDVNNSVKACDAFIGNNMEERGQPVHIVAVSKNSLALGEMAVVEFSVNSPENLVSWELGLRFDPNSLRFLEALPGELEGMNLSNFGTTQASDGKLRVLWVSPTTQPVSFSQGTPSFLLKFKALRPIDNLPALLSLDNSVLQGRAYQADGAASPFQFTLMEPGAVGMQNNPTPVPGLSVAAVPNPFSNELKLVVTTPEDDWLEVSIFSADGRRVASWSGEALTPQQDVVFPSTESWGTGVFTYQVRTTQHAATGKITRQ